MRIDNSSAHFENLQLTDHQYAFEVVSSNEKGDAIVATSITVPSKDPKLDIDNQLIVFHNDDHYLLTWSNGAISEIESFTVFWCVDKKSCGLDLNYRILSSTKRQEQSFVLLKSELKKTPMYFAIAANTRTSSTGMQSFSCISRPENGELFERYMPITQLTKFNF